MKFFNKERSDTDPIEMQAAEWLARIDDGLTGEEQDAYLQWLSEDDRHKEAMSLMQWGWGEMDRLAGLQTTQSSPANPQLLAPPATGKARSRPLISRYWLTAGLGMAAALMLSVAGLVYFNGNTRQQLEFEPAYELMARLANEELPDGSTVELNRGAIIRTEFTRQKRLVHLEGGEANFIVAKDPDRPFVVAVGGIEVRAVGTIFNVKYIGRTVDVIVTEGTVQVDHQTGLQFEETIPEEYPLLNAGQQATIEIQTDRPIVKLQTLNRETMEAALKWQPRLLKFNAAPLRDIINGFNHHNQIQVELGDPELGHIVLTSAFWSDNVEGFVRLMENNFGMRVVWIDRHRIRLVKDSETHSSL